MTCGPHLWVKQPGLGRWRFLYESLGADIVRSGDSPLDVRTVVRLVAGHCYVESANPRMRAVRPHGTIGGDAGSYLLARQLTGQGVCRQGGRETPIAPGDLVVWDLALPYNFTMGRHRNRLLAIPRGELEPFLLDPGVAVNARIANGSPIAVVLSAHLDALWQVANKVDGNVGAALVEDVCRLLALALNSRTSNVDVAGASKTCTQCHPALVAIDRNFEDPSLTPSHVAAELGISRRSLHRLFEDLGVTFSQCLRRRRLAAARRLIAGTRMTITDIAFASGFNDLSTFRRAVRAHYGMAPRDLRRLLVATGPEQMKLPKRDGEDSNHRQPAAPPSALGPQTP